MLLTIDSLPTPCYVVYEDKLERNLSKLRRVADEAGCRVLLAQKAFSMWAMYPLAARYLDGAAASGLFEARLSSEEMGKETHVFSAAYRPAEFPEILSYADHVVFNSFGEWRRYRGAALAAGVSPGIRVNPEHSTGSNPIYDPCSPMSRLGVTRAEFRADEMDGISGIHFHTLCERNADALAETLAVVEAKFGEFFPRIRWINMGGGHNITRADYDDALLIRTIRAFRERHGLDVYIEPGEAIALDAGYLAATVLDIARNGAETAILDASAACHMPDVIEGPYRPPVLGGAAPGAKAFTYRLAGPTCLAGDVVGDYSFDEPLRPGSRVVFEDMAIYTMVKNNTFNGISLPPIAVLRGGEARVIREFGYSDFKDRLS
ncbi:MAG: carboxynorspermidine decarboxylase [Clostridiales bacterium]|nr:carboxynorspermidine decarboxylase [Clostridiales bacterium]